MMTVIMMICVVAVCMVFSFHSVFTASRRLGILGRVREPQTTQVLEAALDQVMRAKSINGVSSTNGTIARCNSV